MPKYRFAEIAYNSTAKKKPTEADKGTYIGLEHLDSGSLTVSRWGAEVAPIGEKLIMKKGDVLFGKRRAYQKKVAIAPFDGIFSAHGMVLRPNETIITKEYFPLFISSDYFLDEAIRISVGSLSPTVNWKDLKNLTFNIPTLEEQRRLTPLVWAAIESKNAYIALLERTDELVKSQFIEMFGDPETNPLGWPIMRLSDIVTNSNNGITRRGNDPNGSIVLRIVELQDGFIDYTNANRIVVKAKEEKCRLKEQDLLFVRVNGNPDYVARSAVFKDIGEPVYHNDHIIRMHIDETRALVGFIRGYITTDYAKKQLKDHVKTSAGQYSISQDGISSIQIYLPSLEFQERYIFVRDQADKSKFELKQSIERIDNLIKSLIQQG